MAASLTVAPSARDAVSFDAFRAALADSLKVSGTLDAVHHYGSLLQAHGQRLGGAEGKRLVDQATPLLKRASEGREQRGLRR